MHALASYNVRRKWGVATGAILSAILVGGCSFPVTQAESVSSSDPAIPTSLDVTELLRTRLVQVPGERPDGVTGFSTISVNGVPVLDFYFASGTVALCFDDGDSCSGAIAGEVITQRFVDIDSIQTDPAVVTIIAVPTEVPTADRTIDVDFWTNVELVSEPPTWLAELSESAG